MNSYTFGISGSWWLFALLILIGTSFSIYIYRHTIPPISKSKKTILISLRSFGIAMLLFLLVEPLITIVSGIEEKPKLTVLLDNSQSIAMKDAIGNRKELFFQGVHNSDFQSLDLENLDISIFDADYKHIVKYDNEVMNFKGQMTDISNVLRNVLKKSENENIGAVLLVTDGAFNSGNNPIYDADLLGIPIYTIGIGDSSEPKDISLESILTNDVMYVDNPAPVNVNIKTSGFKEGEITVTLYDNDNKIGEQKFQIHSDMPSFTAVFEYLPKVEGVHKLNAKVSSLPNEITLKNNTKSEFIEVLKNKRKITIFAGAPSSDLSFIRTVLNEEKGVEIKTFVQKNNTEFYEGNPSEKEFKETELFLLIGYPGNYVNQSILQSIKKELESGKSVFFISSRYLNYNALRTIEDYLPFNTTSSKPNEFLAIPDINPVAGSNPLLRINSNADDYKLWNQLPPVFRTETFVKVKPESELISTMKINNVPLKEPLILSRTVRNQKSVAFLGYGIYRWKLLGYAPDLAKGKTGEPDLFSIFIRNTIKWLSIDVDKKYVEIKTSKKAYINTEKVEFIAQVYDRSFSPVDDATVNVTIKSSASDNIELILNSLGNGRYSGKLEGLSDGGYYFSGDAFRDGKKVGSDNGRFSIGELALEYRNLAMNVQLLRAISERTGGKFYLPSNSSELLNDLKSTKYFKPKSMTIRKEYALWNLTWLAALAILSLSLEWFLRKRAGMI